MTRIVRGATVPPDDFRVTLALIGGPAASEFTEEELRLAWEAYGEDITLRSPGTRPWAWWRFELGEDLPDNEPVRLAELGLLRDDEIAAIVERADEARPRIGTAAEHISGDGRYRPDVLAVELHEAVKRALGQ